ncbi:MULTISPECIES: bifunctional alpha/beta hydrolase/OsmC family protein [Sinorhizobium]|uniref:bifunctional alpha/beta hydrolase/OsmC family protein n=1 Tax=Sinorhizobium TaxID=28105 RepID=UPI000BEA772F|nr:MULTISPECIES: bifunctional alpha/beta hydrolase/OsmC family protein [Sinorhizobium]PDT50986.1 osmotically inducible protein C [Sinorhizobium sp. NG07B]POH25353.1 osmotically inducible protein C [Sinorhizobium americanum]
MPFNTQRHQFAGHSGATLAARLDLPNGKLRAYALFAHCFTCSKDLAAARRIAAELAREGIAVLRFDFTGLGSSEGEFASTNFSSNVADLVSAADYLRQRYQAPSLLIGHSLGGAAVLAVAKEIPEVRAVATIGAPADVGHVLKNFGTSLEEIEKSGAAEVDLAGRTFLVRKQFVEDAREQRIKDAVASLKKPLLILHAPLDETVGIENATEIFHAARHPKSFVSLDKADHLLTDPEDAAFVGRIISGWLTRYVSADVPQGEEPIGHARVTETGEGKFQNAVQAGGHRLFADEPKRVGGLDSGPSPYDFLSIALGACTSMTLRLYSDHKKLSLGRIGVDVSHAKIHAEDCEECTEKEIGGGRIDQFERVISIDGGISEELRSRIEEIAGKCPVHRTLESIAKIKTVVK